MTPNLTIGLKSHERPWPLRTFNRLGESLIGDNGRLLGFDADRLMDAAERTTGLTDWGDMAFEPGLRRLLEALNGEAWLSVMGRLMLRNGVQRFLCNRLKMQRDWLEHPELLQQPVKKPIFIVGLPRTGSTLLQRLLSRDLGARSLQTFEMMEPSAPEADDGPDPRVAAAARRLRVLEWAAPEFLTAHEVKVGEPEECVTLLQNTFVTDAFEFMANMPGYRDWVAAQDMGPVYDYYRRQLQLLQGQRPASHWVLKSPFHQLGLAAILERFPDAIIVQTHRDPLKVVPSWCSLFRSMHVLTSNHVNCHEIGRQRLLRLSQASQCVIDARERFGDARFVDIAYADLLADPIAAVRMIHDRAGLPLEKPSLQAMRSWLDSNPQHKRGTHRYTLDNYGLTPDAVNQALSNYRERYAAYL